MAESEESQKKADPGFIVVDKRGQERSEEPADGAAAENAAPAEHAAPDAGEPVRQLPKVDFSSFLISLASSAMVHLGVLPDPETKEPHQDLQLARHTIDTLEMLQDKTRGNLADEEERLLQQLLTELRMRFVEASR